MKVTVLIPTRGADGSEAAITKAEDYSKMIRLAGHTACTPVVMWGNSCDNIRAELACAFMATDSEVAFCLDDDVEIMAVTDIQRMLYTLQNDDWIQVLAAPYLNKHQRGFFTIPIQGVQRSCGLDVVECATVTLGATFIKRHVFQHMANEFSDLEYDSLRTEGARACALYQPGVLPAALLGDILSKSKVYCGEDKMFCVRAHQAGFKLYATLDVRTRHGNLEGRFVEDPIVKTMLR